MGGNHELALLTSNVAEIGCAMLFPRRCHSSAESRLRVMAETGMRRIGNWVCCRALASASYTLWTARHIRVLILVITHRQVPCSNRADAC